MLTFNDLRNKLYAVHTTNELPVNGKQIAGSKISEDGLSQFSSLDQIPQIRHTLHFCLGRVVPAVWYNDSNVDVVEIVSETRKYAIVTNIENLFPQLVNILPVDTFILGDYEISKKDNVIVPIGTDVKSYNDANIVYYDPDITRIDLVVIDFIKSQYGYIIAGALNENFFTLIDCHDMQTIIKKTDYSIWKQCIQELDISFGCHAFASTIGWQGGYLGVQETIIQYIISILLEENQNERLSIELLCFLKEYSKLISDKLINWVQNTNRFSSIIKANFIKFQHQLIDWHKFLDIELFLIKKYNKTIMGESKKHINYLINNLDKNLDQLYNYLEEYQCEFEDLDVSVTFNVLEDIHDLLEHLNIKDFINNSYLFNDEQCILDMIMSLCKSMIYDKNQTVILDDTHALEKLQSKFDQIFVKFSIGNDLLNVDLSRYIDFIGNNIFSVPYDYDDMIAIFFKNTINFYRFCFLLGKNKDLLSEQILNNQLFTGLINQHKYNASKIIVFSCKQKIKYMKSLESSIVAQENEVSRQSLSKGSLKF